MAFYSKFKNKRTERLGYSFSSGLEAAVFSLLKDDELAGNSKVEKVQDRVLLTDAKIAYIADFKCSDPKTGEIYWVEAKGYETPSWRIKLRLWKFYGPGKLLIYKGTKIRPVLSETVIPVR